MAKGTDQLAIPDEIITGKIYLVRDKKVMLDEDLAELYGVTTGNLNKAVSRNNARFPRTLCSSLQRRSSISCYSKLEDQVGVAVEHLHMLLLSREWQCYQECLTVREPLR